jgi:NMD protein affecting ribosome stability and mRNA decay
MKKFIPSGYYEAKLQIRPKDQELFDFISSHIKKSGVKIVDINELKEGFDIYITSSKILSKLGRAFKNKYKIKPKMSKTLTGEDKQAGKRIYKTTILFRIN